jgi:hypothetical protein
MEPSERALLATTVGDALEGVVEADAVLTALGWTDMLTAEPDAAIAIVFEALGRTNAESSAIDDVVVRALGLGPRTDLAVVAPSAGAPSADRIAGLATARVRTVGELLVFRGEHVGLAAVGDADVEPIQGIDPEGRWSRVGVDPARVTAFDHAGTSADAIALAQRAISHQIAGACRTMLELGRAHALVRVQFGRPVAQFQAVRHRLADALVAIEALDATLTAAADEPGPLTAQLAKAVAGRTARTVATHCQQVLAGVGFTTEHPFHRFLKRTMLLDSLFGSSDELVVTIGRTLLSARRVPTLIDL